MGLFSQNENGKETLYAVSQKENIFEVKDFNAKSPEVNDEKINLKIIEKDGVNFIEFKGKKYQFQLVSKHQNYYEFLINGKSYTYTVETPFSIERKKLLAAKEGESNSVEILAPMPGKIIEIFVEEGSEVHEGDPLVILEAMKMQNEILSPKTGKISDIKIKKDQNVMKDEFMLNINRI